jgi:adenylosuccinate synthase
MLEVDVIVGVQHGDEGKGKVTHSLLRDGDYTHCVRYNGGCNAGHTIYHEGQKYVTHHIPAGVFYGIKSIIGPGCTIDVDKFLEEVAALKGAGFDTDKIYVAKNAHIIQYQHRHQDSDEIKIGTTRTGNGPCYSDKYARTGIRAKDHPKLQQYLIDMYEEFHIFQKDSTVLCEGAQGFSLDIDWGDYPYVTSSHCTVAGAFLNGFPPRSLRKVYGVAKAYETYVGSKRFQPDGLTFCEIQKAGKEYGATTGRRRQCKWMNLTQLQRAIDINSVDHLIVNKVDVLEQVDQWSVEVGSPDNSALFTFKDKGQFCDYITKYLGSVEVTFSGSPECI